MGSITVNGDVNGDIDCKGCVTCGNVKGDVLCDGSVVCGNVGGSVVPRTPNCQA